MTTNKNFAKYISTTLIEYAPTSFIIDSGIIINPPNEMYLKRGWYSVIDDKPEPETGCYVKFNQYHKDDEEKIISAEYSLIMIPVTKDTYTYSKLKLETAMFKIGKSEEFDKFLDVTMLSNDFLQNAPLRKFYDQAINLASDNEYFEVYLKKAEDFLGISDQYALQILKECLLD